MELQKLKHELEQMGANVELQLAPASFDLDTQELPITVIPKLSQDLSQKVQGSETSKLWCVPFRREWFFTASRYLPQWLSWSPE